MDDELVALCEALREIDEGRVVSPTWLQARYPVGGDTAVEALHLESLVATRSWLPSRLGPFRVLREIGRGGMGVVYLAEAEGPLTRPAHASRVAVKVLHARLAGRPDAVQAILREAVLGRQVRHPHVVPVLDAGTCVVGGQSSVYVAMEYVEGAPLSRVLRVDGAAPESLCLRIARDIAHALAAIHARGFVHRDVKPSNILISPSGAALLADMGVAVARSELVCATDRTPFVGTLPYAAPEQIAGAEVDGRADLYALGATLREMAGGGAGGRGHGRGEGGRFLDAVVRKLLAPRRDARFESAAALVDALEGGERSRWWTRRMSAVRAGSNFAAGCRRAGPRFRGRDRELACLRAALEAAKGGEGSFIFISGEAGIGKSRLLDEFLAEAARRDEAFRLWRCAFPPVRDPLRPLPLGSSLWELLAATDQAPESGTPLAQTPDACVSAAEALARELPLVAIFDDLHFASPDERSTVGTVGAAARGHPMLVLASSREPDAAAIARDATLIALTRLSEDAAQDLVRDAIGESVSPEIAARVAARSGGNPFFALSLARMRGAGPGASATQGALPPAIRRFIAVQLSRLPRPDRELLEVSACYGRRIEPAVVARALGRATSDVTRRLASVADEGGLLRGGSAGFMFDHDLIIEALVRRIPAQRRRLYSVALAEALAGTLTPPVSGEAAVVLCRLYIEGDRGADAVRHLDLALDTLAARQAHVMAIELCERVLRVPGLVAGAVRRDLLLRAAAHAHALGRDSEVRPLLDEANRIAIECGDHSARTRVLLQSAEHLVATGHYEQALGILEGTESAADPRVDLVAGRALLALGRPEQACSRLERSIERGAAAGDRRVQGRATVALSDAHVLRARLAEACRGYESARSLCRAAGDSEGEARALEGLGTALFVGGNHALAEEAARQQLELHRRAAERRGEGRARSRIGSCRIHLGDPAEALRQYERSHAIAVETDDLDSEATAIHNLGHALALQGRLADALCRFERAVAVSRQIGKAQGQAIALCSVGAAWVRLGLVEKATPPLEESVAITRRHGIRLGEAHALLALAEARALALPGDDALARYEEALDVRNEAGHDADTSRFRLAIAWFHLRRGESERARPHIEQVLRSDSADVVNRINAAAYSTLLAGDDVRAAVDRVLALEPRGTIYSRLSSRFLLWRATGDIGHLAESYRVLLHLRDHAPREARESVLSRVPLHAAVAAAWARDPAPGPPGPPHASGFSSALRP